jgi:glyoxylase-like metal-dependent hydrolase (beta-lactamase superfamily II)
MRENPSDPIKPVLQYPFETPAPGGWQEVAPGVLWLRMPMPLALNHINLWAVRDGDGWALFDTGMRNEESMQTWRRWWNELPGPHRMTRIFVTHMHPDHVGMAGWMTRKFGVQLWMSRLEYLTCRVLCSDSGREAPAEGVAFYRRAGWSEGALETYRARFGNFGKHIHALPDSFRRVSDGERIRIGEHDWEVVMGNGHSPEHACFHCPDLKLFISGDQVLPRISSNVAVYPSEPEADPMRDWLDSLAMLRRRVPDDVLVLPAHNDAFRGLHARVDYLAASQTHTLAQLRERLATPCRVIDTFATLFGRPIGESDVNLLGMATGEALACLTRLVRSGEATCSEDERGVAWYQAG